MKRTLLITGASSGIGASLLRRFAGDYDQVIAAARRIDRMREEYADYPSVTPTYTPTYRDVSNPDELTAFAKGLIQEHGVVPYLISCAGAWCCSPARRRSCPANTEMYAGPLPPTACHPTVGWLLTSMNPDPPDASSG